MKITFKPLSEDDFILLLKWKVPEADYESKTS